MNPECCDEKLEAMRLEFQQKYQLTDKAIMSDLMQEQYVNSEDDSSDEKAVFDEQTEKFVPAKIEKFSLEEESKHGYFDPNGNYIPEYSDEEESEAEMVDFGPELEADDEAVLTHLRFLLTNMNRNETVCQALNRLQNEEVFENMTFAALQLQFEYEDNTFENIYEMTEKQIGHIYNVIHSHVNS